MTKKAKAKKPVEDEVESLDEELEDLGRHDDDEYEYDDDDDLSELPALPRFAAVQLLKPVRIGNRLVDGTINPASIPEHRDLELYDGGRFFELRLENMRRLVPWVHVGHVTPEGSK